MLMRYTDEDSSELPKHLVNQNLWLVTSTKKTPLFSYSIRITIDEAIHVTDDNLCKHIHHYNDQHCTRVSSFVFLHTCILENYRIC